MSPSCVSFCGPKLTGIALLKTIANLELTDTAAENVKLFATVTITVTVIVTVTVTVIVIVTVIVTVTRAVGYRLAISAYAVSVRDTAPREKCSTSCPLGGSQPIPQIMKESDSI